MSQDDPLTARERNFIERWPRVRRHLLWWRVAQGTVLFGGLTAYLFLHDRYARGQISGVALALSITALMIGGSSFGVLMWALGELRFQRIAAKDNQLLSANKDALTVWAQGNPRLLEKRFKSAIVCLLILLVLVLALINA